LLSISVNDPIGVSTDPAGDLFISHDDSTPTEQREAVEEFPSGGGPAFNLFRLAGPNAHPGALVTLGSSASLPNLRSGAILELQPNGDLFAYTPSTGQVAKYDSLADDSSNASSVFDIQTGTYRNLDGTIGLSGATFGDFAASGNDLVVSGQSNGWDFVMRVSYSENGSGDVTESLTTLIASPASDNSTQPGGVAVNGPGTVLTTLPTAHGTDVPVAFNLFFDQGQTPAPEILKLGLSTQPAIETSGITTDDDGNFVAAAVQTSLLDGDPGYVTITAQLSTFGAQVTATNSTTNAPYVPWGVAVQPTTTGARLDGTIPTANLVLTGPSAYNPPFSGYSPTQIKKAYGVNQITFPGPDGTTIPGDGRGQTIVLMEEGYDPTIESDLEVFSQAYGLPGPTNGITFTQVYQTGENTFTPINPADPPPVYSYWINETSVDVEWAHAIAPEANIMVVDVDNNAPDALQYFFAGVEYAASQPGVSVVSMSIVFPEFTVTSSGADDANMTQYDRDLQAANVTFLAASGDYADTPDYYSNDNTTIGVSYPASSPDVVAVGGTTLPLDAAGDYPGTTGADAEVGWETGPNHGAGGGLSSAEPEPSWQLGVVPTTLDSPSQDARAVPDVAWDSDPATGVNVYTSTFDSKTDSIGWSTVGGTSIAAPQWAGLIAIVDQGRVLAGGSPLTGYDQTLPALYALPAADFHDITAVTDPADASLQAGPGYDEVTGLGTPVANLLVPGLVSYALATQLALSTQPPGSVTAGSGFGLSVTVESPSGSTITDYNGNVTIGLAKNPGSGSLGGTLTATAVDGVASFSGLTLDIAGIGYTIKATASGLTAATTSAFDVVPGAGAQLVISSQPPSIVTAGVGFGLTVTVEDSFNNEVTSDGSTVTLTLSGGTFEGGSSTVATAASSGVATFSNLMIDVPGSYTLSATDGTLTPTGASNHFTISPATASQLVIHTQPSATATAGQAFGTQSVVYEEDQFGNLETSDNSTVVTATLESGTGPLEGTTSATVSGGVAAFTNLADDKAETISLNFTSGSLTNATSNSVVVSPATASKLVIHTQPSAMATEGASFGTQPVVYEEDRFGNLETGDNSTVVTATLESGAGPLQGTTTATVSGGVATFTKLADNEAGTISLNFTSGSLTNATSTNIVVSPAMANKLVIHTQPSSTATAGVAFGAQPVVYEEDQFGNLETGDNSTEVTASLASGAGPLLGMITVTVSGGVATFTNLADTKAGTISLNFTSGSLTNATSNNIVVSPAMANKLVIHTQPSSTAAAGVAFGAQPVVYEEDPFGNLETGDNSTVVSASLETGTGPLQGTTAVIVSGGVATFTNLHDDKAETILLNFRSSSLSSAPTSPIAVTAPAPTIVLEQVVRKQKTNKKGKPVGKPAFVGFLLEYNTEMNPSTAGLAANYRVETVITRRVKKKTVKMYQPINFTAAYTSSNDSVTLTTEGKQTFANGGKLTVIASAPGGVSSAAGVLLDATDTVFTILAKATGIAPG